ncbi:MAG: amidohydrolase family protein [Candidatus Thorarchaeota archaeon]
MRIIDAHTHTWTRDIISQKDLEAREIAAQRDGLHPVLDSPLSKLKEGMQRAGIERAVVLPIDSGLNQDMPLTLQQKTDWHAKEVEGESGIRTFVGLDPRRGEEGVLELVRAVRDKGCIGWKLYPPNGFYPDDEAFYPYYEKASSLGIPIVVHTGFTSRFKHVKYAQPVYIDKVAADFPQLKIVLAHVGTPWVDEALMVSAKNPNVSVDVSGWQIFAKTSPMRLYKMIIDARILRVFPMRMIWGSDFPLFEHAMKLEEWASFFSSLQIPSELIDSELEQINKTDLEYVMWKNAARIFFGERP